MKRAINVWLVALLWCILGHAAPRPVTVPYGVPFVSGTELYDAAGNLHRIRGVNRNHWDNRSAAAIPLTGANTVRLVVSMSESQAYNWSVVDPFIAAGIMPIIGNWNATCKADVASFRAVVDTWVAQVSTWTRYNSTGIINIANEWGPAKMTNAVVDGHSIKVANTTWRDEYVTAVQRMRAAGYNGVLMIDLPGCGQDAASLPDGAAIVAADPQHNIIFDVHIYGSFHYPATATWMQDYAKAMASMKATGLPLVVGEFGPAPYTTITRDTTGAVVTALHPVGPSATQVPTLKIIADAEANGWGWMPWAWDDNNLPACGSSDVGGFSMTLSCGKYTGKDATELTAWGRLLVPILKSYKGK